MGRVSSSPNLVVDCQQLRNNNGETINKYIFTFLFQQPSIENLSEFHSAMESMLQKEKQVLVEVDGRAVIYPSLSIITSQIEFMRRNKEKVKNQVREMKIYSGKLGKSVLNTIFALSPPLCKVSVL